MGHAYQWVATTSRHGIPNGRTPKEGSVAYWAVGTYGHVMYVEKLNGDGTMWVSDYNWNRDGAYHYYKRSTAGLTYIYF
jgi:surface antigen